MLLQEAVLRLRNLHWSAFMENAIRGIEPGVAHKPTA